MNRFLLALALPLAACASSPPPAPAAPKTTDAQAPVDHHVDGKTAKQLVHDGAKLVDVRSPAEFAEKHIEGAENVPVDTVGEANVAGGDKDKPIVLYCGSGKRAARAAETLRAKGYTKVYELGGMSNWDK